MTASLPAEVQQVFERFVTTEYTTIDRDGQPITWPVTPYYRPGGACIDVTTGLGYPKKADDAAANPKVSLLFSDPTGSTMKDPPMVLVQGTATVDDRDLDANRERYRREAVEKLPGTKPMYPPAIFNPFFNWYLTRIYVHVRPERVYVWHGGRAGDEPELFDAHMEEVRSGHDEEAESPPPAPRRAPAVWDERIDELGRRYETAAVSVVAPDGFPFAARVPVEVDPEARVVRLGEAALGMPLAPGRACLAAHEHDEVFAGQRNFQVRGDLVEDERGWVLVPHKLVGGFELPPGGRVQAYRANIGKSMRFYRRARRELRRRR